MRVWTAMTAGEPEFGWLGRLLGTAVVVGTLLTARVPDPWAWLLLGIAAASWFFFVLADHRLRRWPTVALGAGALCAAGTAFATTDSSGVAIAFTSLIMLALHPSVRPTVSVGTGVAVGIVLLTGTVVTGSGIERMAVLASVTAFVTLSGLLRRSYHLRAVETATLLEQTRLAQDEHARAAALDERTRIARELHDVLAHSLGALGVQLEVAEALLAERASVEGAVDAALERVRRSRRLAADGLVEARAAVTALRRDALPLPDALGELAAAHARDHLGPAPEVAVVGEPRPVRAAVGVSLAGAAREALTNAARHAPGAPVRLVLEFRPDAVAVAVRNAAPEQQPGARGAAGHGLAGMRERLALVGGRLTAGPDGGGWAVEAEVPGA